jgi:phosphatidate cytidylyltransferase
MLLVVSAVVWFAPALVLLLAAEVVLALAVVEFAALARSTGLAVPADLAAIAAGLACASFSSQAFPSAGRIPLDAVLMLALIGAAIVTLTRWSGETEAPGVAAATLLPALYLGLPIGSLVAVGESMGRGALFLLIMTVFVSDTAQYYSGRAFGRRPLAPRVSPKKTVEGAIGGFVFATSLMVVAGESWLPLVSPPGRALLGASVVGAGIAGDLFKSVLKRSAGVKDSSTLIPGHGGILDRIDALLFAGPVYYLALRYL